MQNRTQTRGHLHFSPHQQFATDSCLFHHPNAPQICSPHCLFFQSNKFIVHTMRNTDHGGTDLTFASTTINAIRGFLHWLFFSSVAQSCLTLCDPMNCSTPGLPVHHQLPELTQTHVHRVGDAIQPSHPLLSPSPPAPNPSQHQSLFQ